MLNLTGKRIWFFLISVLVIVAGIASLFTFGLREGIDFASGSLLTVSFEQPPAESQLKEELANQGHANAILQRDPAGNFLIRTLQLTPNEKEKLKGALTARFGALTERGFENITPVIARDTVRVSVIAIVLSAVAILLYIAWAYRRVPNPFRYGVCVIAALAHDVLVVLGAFAFFGKFFGWEINLLFVAGILAVIGYSDNSVVVIFDRIRENLRRGISPDFETIVNTSLLETMGRSLNTTLTTLLAMAVVLIFVAGPIEGFVWTLFIGILTSMYSSIFIAPNLLVAWEKAKPSHRMVRST
ncbi:MAG: protein translocase subunit SecF [Chloroflexi bacterium]|nr:protein translocase subunit SecF [Chloroflexota bacterium]